MKYKKGVVAPHSSPWNRSGTNGDNSVSAATAFSCGDADEHAQALALRAVADLIVILRAHHELLGRYAARRSAVAPLPILGILTLIHVALAQCGGDVLESVKVRVVPGRLAGEKAMQGVVEIILPMRLERVAAARRRMHQPRVVEIAFRDQHEAAIELTAQSPYRGR